MFKRIVALFMVLLLSIENFAAVVSDNDGSAFITKAEFDSLKNDFQSQIDQYNTSIDSKIDGAIASYLAGIKLDKREKRSNEMSAISNDGYIYSIYTNDLGMTAGYPDLLLNICFSLGTKSYGGSNLAWRSGGFSIKYTKSSDSLKYSKRLYYRNFKGYTIYDGYWKVNEYFNGIIGVNKVDFDAGFYASTTEVANLFCLCSHNTKNTSVSVGTWFGNLWTKWGSTEGSSTGTDPWKRYYVVDFENIGMSTTKFKPVYQAAFLYDYDETNIYPCWNNDDLADTVIEPEYNVQDTYRTRIVADDIETIWDQSTKSTSWSQAGGDKNGYRIWSLRNSIKDSSVGSNYYGRYGYNNRKFCVRTPDMKKVSEFVQNDTRVLEWKNSDGSKGTLQFYSLSAGVPVTNVEIDNKFEWTPKMINMSDGSTANIDIELYYGPYNGSQNNRITDVTKDSNGKYKFEAKEGAMIFARWPSGYAIDLENSNELYVVSS